MRVLCDSCFSSDVLLANKVVVQKVVLVNSACISVGYPVPKSNLYTTKPSDLFKRNMKSCTITNTCTCMIIFVNQCCRTVRFSYIHL